MAPTLPAMPLPGVVIIPHFTAQAQQTFLLKAQDQLIGKAASLVSSMTPSGEVGAAFLQLKEEEAHTVVFRTMQGAEVMRINIERHNLFRHKTEYKAVRSSDAKVVWEVELKTGWRVPKYDITLHEKSLDGHKVEFEKEVAGEEKGIVVNGKPASTVSRQGEWKHKSPQYIVHVAAGMDILLALGMAWIRSDKQKQDDKVTIIA